MSWLETDGLLIDAATAAMEFAANWFLQSTLLVAIGLLVGMLAARRGAAVQSAVYRTTLVAVLLCPLASSLLGLAGVSGWSLALPDPWTETLVARIEPAAVMAVPVAETPPLVIASPVTPPSDAAVEQGPVAGASPQGFATPAEPPHENSAPAAAASGPPVERSMPQPAAIPVLSVNAWGITAVVLVLLWMATCVACLVKLATAWWRLARLRRDAVPAEPSTLLACRALAARLGVRTPEVLESPYLPSPCLAGLIRPAVLLPEAELSLSMQDVLVHELAHLARRDCHWNLLRQLALAAFFFHPLMWMLSRRLEVAAEEVCDDYVVQYGGDREEYALRLVDIAELSTAPMAAAGVGIVSLRSMLARRVQRIMDTSRSLSTRVGNLLLALVLVGGLVGTTVVGLVGIGPQALNAEVAEGDTASKTAEVDKAKSDEAGPDESQQKITVRGRVLDAAGQAIAGADVQITRSRALGPQWRDPVHEVLATAKADADGRFSLPIPYEQNDDRRRNQLFGYLNWQGHCVVARAPGFAPTWIRGKEGPVERDIEIKLEKDDVKIRGRLVDLEGLPIAGVHVAVKRLIPAKPGAVDEWLKNVADLHAAGKLPLKGSESVYSHESRELELRKAYFPMSSIVMQGHPQLPADTTTDADGRFETTGVGPDRLVQFEISGPRVVKHVFSVVAREMPPVEAQRVSVVGMRSHVYYGATFDHVVEPGQTVKGLVKDAASGAPLARAGVSVTVGAGSRTSVEGMHTTVTDAEGRFQLEGLPVGKGNELKVEPNDTQPYLLTQDIEVAEGDGTEPVEVEIKLQRGVFVRGRVFEQETGKPVDATVHYHPFLSNPHTQQHPRFNPDVTYADYDGDRYRTNANGEFQTVVIPGQGILAARTIESERYCKGVGAEGIEGLDERDHFPTYDDCSPRKYNRLALIDVPEDATAIEQDLPVQRGRTATFELVDANNQPLVGVRAANLAPWSGHFERALKTNQAEVVGLRDGESRQVSFWHEEKKLGRVVEVKGSATGGKLELLPCATVTGRLLDGEGNPLVKEKLNCSMLPGGDYSLSLEPGATDSDGRFRFDGLLSGASYQLGLYSATFGWKDLAKELSVEPGEVVDLGTIDVTKDERPEPGRMKMTAEVPSDASTPAVADAGPVAEVSKGDDAEEFQGSVVDPNGKPVAGAELYLVYHVPQATGLYAPTWKPVSTTSENGAFRFKVRAADVGAPQREYGFGSIVAVKEGFGFAWSQAAVYETSGRLLAEAKERLERVPPELRDAKANLLAENSPPLALIADDEPIRGRVMDINGQPVVGAKLTLMEVWGSADGNLSAWRTAAEDPKADYYSARMKTGLAINGPQVRSLVKPAVSDSDGRFTLRGVGQGRIAELLIEGPGIETTKLFARTEAGKAIELVRERRSPDLGTYTYYPAEFTYVAGPSAVITGVVRDAETKAPLAGVTIKSQARHGERINGWGQDFVRAVTDAEGQYRLEGMPIGEDNRIAAIRPAGDVAYLSIVQKAETTSPARPLTVDFDLRRGVWIEGRVTDKATGEPKTGVLSYYVRKDNPLYATARTMRVDQRDSMRTDRDGWFRIAGLPGPGLVTIMADGHDLYPRADSILKLDGTREKAGGKSLQAEPSYLFLQNYHVVAEVNPAADAKKVTLNLELDGGTTVAGRVVDSDGKPLGSFYYSGHLPQFPVWKAATEGNFELLGYDPATPRHVYFHETTRNLAGSAIVSGKAPENLIVKLQSGGTVKGRVLDQDGEPAANVHLIEWSPPISIPEESTDYRPAPLPHNVSHSQIGRHETDNEGRFEISGLAPGVEYRLRAMDKVRMAGGSRSQIHGPLEVVLKTEPGEVKDLGDVRLVDEAKFTGSLKSAKLEPPHVTSPDETVVKGRVTLADGTPAADATVAAVATPIGIKRGGDFSWVGSILAEGKTDQDGSYRLSFAGVSSKTHQSPQLLARKDGYGVSWHKLNLDAAPSDASFVLPVEAPIRGRLIDIEGQPAAGVVLTPRSVSKSSSDGTYSRDGAGFLGEQSCAAWLAPATSDAEGRFVIHGVPVGHGVYLDVATSERFAPQSVMLNTGIPEQRGERDATYRSLVRNVAAGEEAVLPLSPAQLFEGVVRYEDTGEPAPHARLTIWASQQENFGSMSSVAGKADAEGRFRISPHPGVRFGINAYAPDGTPYLGRETPHDEAIRWQAGDRVKQVDVKLPRGVLVRGKIVEAGSNAPVAGATIQYVPEGSNNPLALDHILTGWQAIELSDENGNFSIAVLPGPGRLLVHGPQGRFVLKTTSDIELTRGKPGGRRNYAHAIERITPEVGSEPLELSIELKPGATISGRLVDEQGNAIDEATVVSSLEYTPHSLHWRGFSPPALGGKFALSGLEENQDYNVYFLDAKRRLGATQTLRADSNDTAVVLSPCGEASARFVNRQGEPLVKFNGSLHIVVTPGIHEHDWSAAKTGKMAADADFVANVDRTNYSPWPMTNEEGRITFPALIPGAIYRIDSNKDGKPVVLKEFSVKSGEKIDLGEFAIDSER